MVLLAGGLASCTAESAPPLCDLFRMAASTAEGMPRVRYGFEAVVSGVDGDRRLEGTVLIERLDLSGGSFRARVEATEANAAGGRPRQLLAVRQRHDIYLLDHETLEAQHGSLYAGGSSLLYRADPALMYAFYDPHAVASEALAAEVVFEAMSEIGGEPCRLVYVTYSDDEDDSRWCLRTSDGLPLMMEWVGAEVTTRLEIFDVSPVEALADSDFSVEIPVTWTLREKTVGQPFGTPVEPWELATTNGGLLTLADLRGQVVVLDFWATWCPPCITTLDNLEDLQEAYGGQPVRLIAVNTMESGDPVAFLAEHGYTFDTLLEGDELHARVAPGSLPSFAVIDADGNWSGAGLGYYGEGSKRYMSDLIDAALLTVGGE